MDLNELVQKIMYDADFDIIEESVIRGWLEEFSKSLEKDFVRKLDTKLKIIQEKELEFFKNGPIPEGSMQEAEKIMTAREIISKYKNSNLNINTNI